MSESLEEFLAAKLKAITARVKKDIGDAIGEIEYEYLPWLETDYHGNAPSLAQAAIVDFAAGRDNDLVNLNAIMSRAAFIDALYERHGDKIIAKLGEDYREKIKLLQELANRSRY